jgi:hypothetical protein
MKLERYCCSISFPKDPIFSDIFHFLSSINLLCVVLMFYGFTVVTENLDHQSFTALRSL